jgi:hypothetical protein
MWSVCVQLGQAFQLGITHGGSGSDYCGGTGGGGGLVIISLLVMGRVEAKKSLQC